MRHKVRAFSGIAIIAWVAALAWAQRTGKDFERPVRHAIRGTHGAIATGSDPAAEAGMRMYFKGGNAVDAGVAAMFAGSIVEYSHFGFGGEAPILIRTKDGKVHSIAGVGTMPKLATAEFFRQRRLQPFEVQVPPEPNGLKGIIPVTGLMPALVPSMVEAGLVALREYGTKSFAEISAAAIELADGTPIDEMRAGRHRAYSFAASSNSGRRRSGYSCLGAGRRCLAIFSANPTWRGLFVRWLKPSARLWPPAAAALRPSTR